MRRFTATVVSVALAGLLYVYAEVEAVKVGYEIRKQEETKTQFLDRARALKYNIAQLKAPDNLERKLSAQRIVLESPKSWQTLVVPGNVQKQAKHDFLRPIVSLPPILTKFLVGTAQAEAKES